jgi:hypothetical protein
MRKQTNVKGKNGGRLQDTGGGWCLSLRSD